MWLYFFPHVLVAVLQVMSLKALIEFLFWIDTTGLYRFPNFLFIWNPESWSTFQRRIKLTLKWDVKRFHISHLLSTASVLYGVVLHFSHSPPPLTGLLNGNIYHVQRPHREERLPHRLGHHEHDAEQVSAACVHRQASLCISCFSITALVWLFFTGSRGKDIWLNTIQQAFRSLIIVSSMWALFVSVNAKGNQI